MFAGKFPLVSMGGRAEGLACADPGARTPIGASGNLIDFFHNALYRNHELSFISGLTGLTAGATVSDSGQQCSSGFSLFTNLNYYKSWIESKMRGSLATCRADLLDVRKQTNKQTRINFG